MTEIEIIALLSALIPAVVLLGYIYWQDRKSPEPVQQLLKATALGVLAIPLVLAITTPLESLGILTFDVNTVWDAINVSFLGAAIPEELSKLFILWLFLLKVNQYSYETNLYSAIRNGMFIHLRCTRCPFLLEEWRPIDVGSIYHR
jgi:RsiW-degrading membrane proteinase PrsW (M82 family)